MRQVSPVIGVVIAKNAKKNDVNFTTPMRYLIYASHHNARNSGELRMRSRLYHITHLLEIC